MDILIKNMEVPKKCFDCGFCHDGDRIRYCLATPWQKEIRKEVFPKRREDFCPLIPLPEHGCLVNKDDVLACIEKRKDFADKVNDEICVDLCNLLIEDINGLVEATE